MIKLAFLGSIRCNKPSSINLCFDRYFSSSPICLQVKKRHFEWFDSPDGIKHHGFTYYPRPGEVEPVIEPSRFFMVQRIKSLSRQPYWIKDIIEELKLDTCQYDKAIVKNTPEQNKKLWTVKHLVKITPITFPYGVPKEGDQGYLNDKGQYILIKKIGPGVDKDRLEASQKFFSDPKQLDADTRKKKLRDIWLTSRK